MANARKFKTGDVVQLKSGGPKMTVRCYSNLGGHPSEGGEYVSCQWFAGSKAELAQFPEESVQFPVPDKK